MSDKRIQLSRRKLLAGLGSVGLASAGAGVGTTALFSDEESFENNSVMAGDLDLKIDWEEHYSFPQIVGKPDPAGGLDVTRSDPNDAAYVGLPDPDDPVVWIHEDDLDAYMSNTAIEAFPDPDNDGEQEVDTASFTYDPCDDGADSPEDLTPTGSGATRTANDNTTSDGTVNGTPQSLIKLEDVKPGDFGEFTFSFHLCSNPGYVRLKAANVSKAENGLTEPEESDGDTVNAAGELVQNIQTAWWYDDGDNVFNRGNCDQDTIYLTDHSGSTKARVYEVVLNESTNEAETTQLVRIDEFDASHIAASPDGETLYVVSEFSPEIAIVPVSDPTNYSIQSIDPNGYGPLGNIVQASVDAGGTLYVGSKSNDAVFEIPDPAGSTTVTNRLDLDVNIDGADNVFASNGQLYLYVAGGDLYTVNLVSGATTKVSTIGKDLTGLAVRQAGSGDFIGSVSQSDEIVTFDADGTDRTPFELTGALTSHTYGDLTTGDLCERLIRRGTLADDLTKLTSEDGLILSTLVDECFEPGFTRYIGFAWWVPEDVGNEIQSDSVEFDLIFETEQCRNNPTPFAPD